MNNHKLNIAAIRATVIDGTNKAKSGHPGMAIGSAPLLYTLYTRHLVSDPTNPTWINRDRFVLSAGHASMLLYATLHFAGYSVTLDDLKNFRQLHSITPGHPEYGMTPGVDATTGPLGQGIAQAVGLATAEAHLNAKYPAFIDHYTYTLVGDGCLQEGISQEAISFAGHQKLNKLIAFYDSNAVTLDGPLSDSFDEDVTKRFEAANWTVLHVEDGNDIEAIDKAISKAKTSKEKPTLIVVKTIIGQGSKNQGTSKVHGSPLGEEDGLQTKLSYGYTNEPWVIPSGIYETFNATFRKRGMEAYSKWVNALEALKTTDAALYETLTTQISDNTAKYLEGHTIPTFPAGLSEATRKSSGTSLNELAKIVPTLLGGSADVASSVVTNLKGEKVFGPETRDGRNINFGIREFGMAAFANGMLLHGGLRPYVGTFLVFSDYMKNAIRLSALSHLPAIYVFSHDSVALGEDGPTHQPIEHLAMLRAMPNVHVWRPADAHETHLSWLEALKATKTPNVLILSRQNLPLLPYQASVEEFARGAYIVAKEDEKLDFTLIATGSEVSLALDAKKLLKEAGVDVRVVSMPSFDVFSKQDEAFQKAILGEKSCHRISVEMLTSFGWDKFAKHHMSVDTFGYSAKMEDIVKFLNFTPEGLKERVLAVLENK